MIKYCTRYQYHINSFKEKCIQKKARSVSFILRRLFGFKVWSNNDLTNQILHDSWIFLFNVST